MSRNQSAGSGAPLGATTTINDTNTIVPSTPASTPRAGKTTSKSVEPEKPSPPPAQDTAPVEPVAPTPQPVEPQPTEVVPPPPPPEPSSSTIIPSISIAPSPSTSRQPKTSARPTQAPPPVPVPVPEPSTLESVISSSPPTSQSSSKAAPSSTSSVPGPANGAPFAGEPSTGQESSGKKPSNGGKIAGAIGGLSAAILIGLLLFFLWKWKTRGKYRFNKRQSFDPYGNGIDANRGGLLVSSVACKPGDNLSASDTAYSDDNSPTRYHRRSVDLTREPKLPVLGDSPPNQPAFPTMAAQPPPRTATFEQPSREQFAPYKPEMAMVGAMAPVNRPGQRGPPVLYDRRRPPVPPSMRRNRSPPNRGFDGGAMEMQRGMPPANSPPGAMRMGPPRGPPHGPSGPHSPHGPSMPMPRPAPGPYPGYAGPNQTIRSNSISSQTPTRPPDFANMERNQRVRRSMSLSSLNAPRFRDPRSLHPSTIPEIPSNHSSPRVSTNLPPAGAHQRSASLSGPVRPETVRTSTNSFWADPEPPRQLMVRNPSPPPAEKNRKQLGDMVRRMGSMRQGGEHKPEDAAKNF